MPRKKATIENLWGELCWRLEDLCEIVEGFVYDVGPSPTKKKKTLTSEIEDLVEKINTKFAEEKENI